MRNFSPAYFGMAMATGIVGIDASVMGLTALAHALFVFNAALYGLLDTHGRALRAPSLRVPRRSLRSSARPRILHEGRGDGRPRQPAHRAHRDLPRRDRIVVRRRR